MNTCCECKHFVECGCGIGGTEPHGHCDIVNRYVDAGEGTCEEFVEEEK